MRGAEPSGAQKSNTTAAAFHAAYRVLASLFLPPDPERMATVVVAVPELRSITRPVTDLAEGGPFEALLTRLEGMDDGDLERLEADHTALFLSGTRDNAVQPYESWHVGVGGYEQPAVSAGLSRRYRESGLVVGIPGELPDHVAVELEFCAYLCHEEGDAQDPAARRWQRERRAFLVEHPLRWLAAFQRALKSSIQDTPYATFAGTARAVIVEDRTILDALLSDDPVPAP